MVDHGGDIQAGIRAYSGVVKAEGERLSRETYDKLLNACNDDGAIIAFSNSSRAFWSHC
jgi:hypothetical protein